MTSKRMFKLPVAALAVAFVVGVIAITMLPSATPALPGEPVSLYVQTSAANPTANIWTVVGLVCLGSWVLGVPTVVISGMMARQTAKLVR